MDLLPGIGGYVPNKNERQVNTRKRRRQFDSS